jgi:alpha-L-rhamnosidase
MASLAGAAFSAGAALAASAAPGYLRCEYRVTPMGLDEPQPRLSLEVRDDRRGAAQKAYRLVVSADPKAPETGPT